MVHIEVGVCKVRVLTFTLHVKFGIRHKNAVDAEDFSMHCTRFVSPL